MPYYKVSDTAKTVNSFETDIRAVTKNPSEPQSHKIIRVKKQG